MNFWVALVCMVFIEVYVLRRLRFDWTIVAIVSVGTILCVDYLTYTSFEERNWDAEAQIRYIQTISEHLRLPDVYDCAPCGHPPLYYAIGALWSKVVLAFDWMPLEQGLQWLSLLLNFGFIVFALKIFRNCIERPETLRLATVLLVFWPSGIINSVRVHNDSLASPLMLAAIYFLARWDKTERNRDYYAALVASAFSLLTKASGYTVAAALVFFAAVRLGTTGICRAAVTRVVVTILVLGSVAVSAVGFRESKRPINLCQKVFGRACDGRYVPPVSDTPSRFLSFDVDSFVQRRIYPETTDPFLNQLTKSSLFGMQSRGDDFNNHRHEILAQVMSVLLLLMLAVFLAGVAFVRRANFQKYRVHFGAAVIMFIFLLAFRVRAPNELHEDFRHIFPILVPFCLGYAVAVDRIGRCAKPLYYVGVGIAGLMVVSSILFFVW